MKFKLERHFKSPFMCAFWEKKLGNIYIYITTR